ncbi:hypothetical protein [Tabrizicola sp.]|uniref:hypothetical protein n=1 Tax=Tabrizicola sp. TaxID=2005166 RepID=UPI003F2A82C9
MLLVGGLVMATAVYAFQRLLNEAVLDRRYEFSEEEIARGDYCEYQLGFAESALILALEERMGDQLDDRIHLSLMDIELGPLRPDGTHRMVALYRINRIGEKVLPAKKATGHVVHADCSVKISTFQN